MKTHQKSHPAKPTGFTLVELLIGMTIIAILAGLVTVVANNSLTKAKEFAIVAEMQQLESALEQFEIQYGFFPPSFKQFAQIEANDGPEAAATAVLSYLNRISPNHQEGTGALGSRPIDTWWNSVGTRLADSGNNPGADLVFWLSGLAKNKQFLLTDGSGGSLSAHNAVAGNMVEREVFYEFNQDQLQINGLIAAYSQNNRKFVPYIYLDANNYLPSSASANDGAYCFGGLNQAILDSITDGTISQADFDIAYPNPDSFQLVTFGLDAAPGVTTAPNSISSVMNFGADNIVNFGNNGPARLDVVLSQ